MKIKQTLLIFALVIGISGFALSTPVSAADNCTDSKGNKYSTSILPCGDGINGLLKFGIGILNAGIGVAAVGGVIYGSILYTTAGGSTDQTKQAKKIIFNVVIGLAAYALAFSFLSFIIPGGIPILP